MDIVKRDALILLLFSVLAFAMPVVGYAADNAAWGKTQWGMTPAEVKQILGDDLEEKEVDGKLSLFKKGYPVLTIAFDIIFSFGNQGLEEVELLEQSFKLAHEDGDRIIASLTAKYGKLFSYQEIDLGEGKYNFEYKWVSNTSVIKAKYQLIPNLDFKVFSIKYLPVAQNDDL